MTARCNHTGSSCIHRRFEPQAVRRGPEPAGWRDAIEALAGVLVLLLFAVGFWLWASILVAVQP